MHRAAGLALCCTTLLAQEAIRVTTRLVLVNVNVEDKDGRPVADLRAEDFIVQDGKKREEIRVFSRQSDGAVRTPAEI